MQQPCPPKMKHATQYNSGSNYFSFAFTKEYHEETESLRGKFCRSTTSIFSKKSV